MCRGTFRVGRADPSLPTLLQHYTVTCTPSTLHCYLYSFNTSLLPVLLQHFTVTCTPSTLHCSNTYLYSWEHVTLFKPCLYRLRFQAGVLSLPYAYRLVGAAQGTVRTLYFGGFNTPPPRLSLYGQWIEWTLLTQNSASTANTLTLTRNHSPFPSPKGDHDCRRPLKRYNAASARRLDRQV